MHERNHLSMVKLTNITLSGYKSIEHMSLDLGPLNVLIGPNGAGKSNFVSFFKLLNEMMGGRLQDFIGTSGGADSLLFYGKKTTPSVEAVLTFKTESGENKYSLRLAHAAGETFIFTDETVEFRREGHPGTPVPRSLGAGHRETRLHEETEEGDLTARSIRYLLNNCRVFQFHDTSDTSKMRGSVYIHENRFLRSDAGNIAAILYKLRETEERVYHVIIQTIRQVVPRFDDFVLEPMKLNVNNMLLNWHEKDSDVTFGPHQFSDGSLRAMALITLLLQPRADLPSVIVIDEPELGLHPHAMVVVASLIKAAACHCQIVIATQSTCLLDQFEAEDVIVVDRDDRKSVFKRLTEEDLTEWLEEYSLSELWEKNVLGGGPV